MRLHIAMLLVVFSLSVYAIDDLESKKIQQRIRPVGQVHIQVAGEIPTKIPAEQKATTEVKEDQGKAIYEQHCVVCHRDGIAGAPKLQNEKDWKARLAGRTLKDSVLSSTTGLNAMPAKGTCNECTEKDLEQAIQYMLPKS